jgi:hypothetical protein
VGTLTATLAASFLMGAPSISVSVSCPTKVQVEKALSDLPSGSDDSLSARITHEAGGIRLELVDATGSVQATRTLPNDPICQRLARSVAVVLAAWAAELPEAPVTPPTAGMRLPLVSNQVEVSEPPILEVTQPDEPSAPYAGPLRLELGLGPLASMSSGGATAAVAVFGLLVDRDSGFGGLLTVLIDGKQTEQLSGGSVTYQRVGFALGPAHRWSIGPFDLDVDADGVIGLLLASGSGYPSSSAGTAMEPGLRAGARLAMGIGEFQAWVGGWGLYWFGQESLEIAPAGTSYLVPNWEVLAGAGVGYRLF